jgi:PEP-CTERM/exosortase A-associated glycosyltransferase
LRRRILQIAKAEEAGIIYAHSPALCGLAALQAARKLGLPFVYEIRAFWEDAANQNGAGKRPLRSWMTRRLETYVARHADAVAAIARPMLNDLLSRGIQQEKLFHVPNGVNTARFRPQARDEALARELDLGEHPVFGFFGSLYRYEGIGWLVRAAALLRARGHNFKILLVGQGEDRPEIDRAIRDCDASSYIHAIEHVPHEHIARYYSVIDIAVYPRLSLRLTELVTPLKPLEAMAFGKPVLASDVGGVKELVESEFTGLLFAAEDIPDFCRQAERMIKSPSLRKSLGDRGRKFVEGERDWSILAKRYREIYEFVLKSNVRKAR